MRAKKSRSRSTPYTGDLATPVVVPIPPAFEGAVTPKRVAKYWARYAQYQQDARAQLSAELGRRMLLLLKHFDIDEQNDDAMSELAYLLACEHVPGFRVLEPGFPALEEAKTQRGRKRKWDFDLLQALHAAVQSAKKQLNFNDRQALTFLASLPNSAWERPPAHKGTKRQWIETLETRLQEAKRQVATSEDLARTLDEVRAEVLAPKFRK
jgi:hypothetical protein